MKQLLFALSVCLLCATVSKAQVAHIPSVTKISTATATIGGATVSSIVFEDTVVSRTAKYLPLRKGDAFITYTGTGTATRLTIIDKASRLIFSGKLNAIRVVGASDTTTATKATYLKANGY